MKKLTELPNSERTKKTLAEVVFKWLFSHRIKDPPGTPEGASERFSFLAWFHRNDQSSWKIMRLSKAQ
jgi:hypothetical protein